MNESNKKRVKEKASFYFKEKLICHIVKEPKGFVNGWFRSDLNSDSYYWFEDQRWPKKEMRLFLEDIFSIDDYQEGTKK